MSNVVGRDTNRVPLYSVVPRSVPFAIGISASDVCNFKCIYCNQATEEGIREARILNWTEFLLIEKQIQELINQGKDRLKIIKFTGNGEPLINKQLAKMIKSLADKDLADRYEVTTNGSLLTHELSDELIDSGLTRLLISVQGISNEKYKKVCGFNIDMDKYISEIQYFYEKSRGKCSVHIKTVNIAIDSDEEKRQFYDMFSGISDTISIENIIASNDGIDYSEMLSDEEMNTTRYNTPLKKKICCDTLFMYMNIHSNGDVDTCGCIYPPLFTGNIFEESLVDLWNGKQHKEYMIKHLTGERNTIERCSKCQSIDHYCSFEEDNLDDHLDEVLEKVLKL